MSKVNSKVCIVTGGGDGIGKALCEELAISGARGVYVVDINTQSAKDVAEHISSLATNLNFRSGHNVADVGNEEDVKRVIASAWDMFGVIDIFFSNAGIFTIGGVEVSNEAWEKIWNINVMSHIFAARHLFPLWKRNNIQGTFVITASAAGLLMQIGCLPYHVTKHAAVSIADWLAVAHYEDGVAVHCVCPQGVRTNMLTSSLTKNQNTLATDGGPAGIDGIAEPKDVAIATINGLHDETFLILPHPNVKTYLQRKATDYDRWIKGMIRSKKHFEALLSPQSKL